MKRQLISLGLVTALALITLATPQVNPANPTTKVASAAEEVVIKKTTKVGKPFSFSKFKGMDKGDTIYSIKSSNERVVHCSYSNGKAYVFPLKEGKADIYCISKDWKRAKVVLTVEGTYRRAKAPYCAFYDVAHRINNGVVKYESITCIPRYDSKKDLSTIDVHVAGIKSATKEKEHACIKIKCYDKNKKFVSTIYVERPSVDDCYVGPNSVEDSFGFSIDASFMRISQKKFKTIKYFKHYKM